MKFSEEIKKIKENFFWQELCLSAKGGYFIGVKKIISFTDENIAVTTQFSKIVITGKNLKVAKLIEGDLAFSGEVEKVEFERL